MVKKHTPGPWTYHANGDGSYSILGAKLSEKEYQWIAGFWHNGNVYTIEQLANVKLMALAPELLKQLEKILKYNKDTTAAYQMSPSLIHEIETLINKAM